jgi:hypothetical protein
LKGKGAPESVTGSIAGQMVFPDPDLTKCVKEN